MNLTSSTVSFRLLPQGREALKGIVPENEFLEGFVVDENHSGSTSRRQRWKMSRKRQQRDCRLVLSAR
jgi:hypothetical protein